MIKYDLECGKGHGFEAWFKNSGSYDEQSAAGTLACPLCGSGDVKKALMAPRIGKAAKGNAEKPSANRADSKEALQALRKMRDYVIANFDDVGERFPEEARRIHYGETEAHNIYGKASDEEAEALKEEGVAFQRLPFSVQKEN
jgi:hypothetical protein